MRFIGTFISSLALCLLSASPRAHAAEEYALTIKNHQYQPSEIAIPADAKVKIVVKNADSTAEEFESVDLNREKVVPAGGQIVLFIGPLPAGAYEFFGDFHPDTARGRIVVH